MADFDAVIVGAGAGGGVAAWVLASRGWKVALIEKGRSAYRSLDAPVLRGSLFGNDEIRVRRYYAMHDPFIEPRTFRDGPSGELVVGDVQPLGVGVGGGTLFYDADSPRVQGPTAWSARASRSSRPARVSARSATPRPATTTARARASRTRLAGAAAVTTARSAF
ncbi:MAG: NAD(P)-binding protein [Deltaproteobacteria bacterium]|nr:NAD(P)-binding protein [Deltaproteobacteria bacterium]